LIRVEYQHARISASCIDVDIPQSAHMQVVSIGLACLNSDHYMFIKRLMIWIVPDKTLHHLEQRPERHVIPLAPWPSGHQTGNSAACPNKILCP
jgi:hypothetical protein